MEQSNILLKIFNIVFPFADFLYILQLEEYSSKRLLKWLPRFFFRRNFQVREKLNYTKRVKITLAYTLFLWIISLLFFTYVLGIYAILLLIPIWLIYIPFFVLLSNWLLSSYFELLKSKIRKQAQQKIQSLSDLKVIVVAGSYGKTTVKNFIYQFIRYHYKTEMIPGNINTPAGIADWINTKLPTSTEILIAEVDAYEIGEIKKSCEIIPADIAILTNVGDQHLERFENETNLAKALSEVFVFAKNKASLLTRDETVIKLKAIGFETNSIEVINSIPKEFAATDPLLTNLSDSNKINMYFALKVAAIFSIPEEFVIDTIKKIELPDRRQQLTKMFGYDAIDDSYNISFTTAKAGILAAQQQGKKLNKKLLIITAGIPELAPDKRTNNYELGRFLAQYADHVVILNSIFASEIFNGTDKKNAEIINNLSTFTSEVARRFPTDEWFLLVQPELNDLYY